MAKFYILLRLKNLNLFKSTTHIFFTYVYNIYKTFFFHEVTRLNRTRCTTDLTLQGHPLKYNSESAYPGDVSKDNLAYTSDVER